MPDEKLRIAAIHSGKHRNHFTIVGIEVSLESKKIYVKYVKRWKGRSFIKPGKEIPLIYLQHKIKHIFVDQNNIGEHIIRKLKDDNVTLKVITTSKILKDPKKIIKAKTMDKTEMVSWFVNSKELHQIIFPEKRNSNVMELERQLSIFSEHKTESGNIDYFAPGEENDDMILALILACFGARNYLKGKFKRLVASKKNTKISRQI